ncbi:MAG: ABC transporter ATP-binding protein [Thermoleophilia bacterium]
MPPVIVCDHLHKRYRHVAAVVDASFEVERGEIFGLLGSNGAGKTTTVECVQGLRPPTSGRIEVLGKDPLTHAAALRGRIGCQLQESRLPDHLRVWEALDLFAGLTSRAPDWRVLLQQWGLEDKRNASFGSLSGGQRQRLFIALALVSEPEVVFLDEMTTGLDPAARRIAWELIEQVRDRGTTVVLVTHFMDEAERLCDRVAVVDAGRVVAIDTPRGLVAKHSPWERVIFSSDAPDMDWLLDVPGAERLTRRGRRTVVEGDGPLLVLTAAALANHGIYPADLRVEEPRLEDVFLRLTGHLVED